MVIRARLLGSLRTLSPLGGDTKAHSPTVLLGAVKEHLISIDLLLSLLARRQTVNRESLTVEPQGLSVLTTLVCGSWFIQCTS